MRRIPRHLSQTGTRLGSTLGKLTKPAISIQNTQLFINNRFVDSFSGKTLDTIDPRNDCKIISVSEGFEEDINIAVDAAYDAFYNGPWYNTYTPSERGRILNKWEDLIEQNIDELATIESWDVGQPLQLAKTFASSGLGTLRYCAVYADKVNGATLSPDAPGFMATT